MNSIQELVHKTVNGLLDDEPFVDRHCNPISGCGLARFLRDLESLGYAKCNWNLDWHKVHPDASRYYYDFYPHYADLLETVVKAKIRLTQNS